MMSALCYNMNEICTVLGAGGWLKIVIWIILLAAALMQVYYIKQHYKELPQPAMKANGAHTRLKDDKYAWPDDSAFFDGEKPKQIHNGGKRRNDRYAMGRASAPPHHIAQKLGKHKRIHAAAGLAKRGAAFAHAAKAAQELH